MNKEPIFHYNQKKHTATCIASDGSHTFIGVAHCHPNDADFESQKTGFQIAALRATIKSLKYYRSTLKIRLSTLNDYLSTINHGKNSNPDSYERKMLDRKIEALKADIDYVNEEIATNEADLKTFIEQKNRFYIKVRLMRKQKGKKA